MQSLLLRNLKFTIPTALVFLALGYIISIPMSFYLDAYAAKWQFNLDHSGLRIETERLDTLRKFQTTVALGSAILGVVVAQTTFAMCIFVEKDDYKSEG
ncbi:hypothetical protein [Fischerella sp. JS2]|uniref:hypothetical protein n=1 Tax=Fischerella sp. JS2 TaxID=2597771 RepID=UPI0028E5AF19|nr:hypothetical protein [Fischerella sp. JS2]